MKNFERLVVGIDVAPLLIKVERMPELWREITLRQDYPNSAHHDTETIFLRGPRSFTRDDYFFDLGSYDYPAMQKLLHEVLPIFESVFEKLQIRELGRMLIVKLQPSGVVDPHIDEGYYADYFSRFHICLQAEEGSTITAGDETQHFAPGEAWWFNHKAVHYANNKSDKPRIHMIFDAVSPLYPPKKPPETKEEPDVQRKVIEQVMGMGKVFKI